MEDKQLAELYRAHDERAQAEGNAAYGRACNRIALNVLENTHEAEVCTEEALQLAADTFPSRDPVKPAAFLYKVTRSLSLDRYKLHQTAKRGNSLFILALDELDACIPAGSTGFASGFDDEIEARRVGECINRFLRRQAPETRDLFICRYFYADSIGDITDRFGLNERQVRAILSRTRKKLRKFLESEGIRL